MTKHVAQVLRKKRIFPEWIHEIITWILKRKLRDIRSYLPKLDVVASFVRSTKKDDSVTKL